MMSLLTSSAMEKQTPVDPFRAHVDSLELAGKMLEKSLHSDNAFPSLLDLTQVSLGGVPTVSGLTDMDYPNIDGISSIKQITSLSKVPLPREVMEHFGRILLLWRNINLTQRIAYLARSVMCMRSDKVGCAPHLGIFLQELEDKIDVAHVQQQILDKISAMPRSQRTEEAIDQLNNCLFNCTEMYEKFAEPFSLWDCKLAIVHCAGHLDVYLIEAIWRKIIETELHSCGAISPNDIMSVVMCKVKSLGQEYSSSARCVPIAFLVNELEVHCCRIRADPGLIHPVMLLLGVPLLKLIQIYDSMLSENELVWYKFGNEFHLIEVISKLLDNFTSNPQMVNPNERRITVTRADDLLTKCLMYLYCKPNTEQLVELLRGIQTKLNRMIN